MIEWRCDSTFVGERVVTGEFKSIGSSNIEKYTKVRGSFPESFSGDGWPVASNNYEYYKNAH